MSKECDGRLRIALVNENWTAGATRCARDLERGLADRHTVRYYPRTQDETAASLHADLAEFRPDVVHLHSYYGSFPYPTLAALSRRYACLFTVHDPRPYGTMQTVCWDCGQMRTCYNCPLVPPLRRYSGLFNTYFLRRTRRKIVHLVSDRRLRLVAPSAWMERRLRATELARFDIRRTPYGIDLEHFRPRAGGRERLGLPPDAPLLLYVAHGGAGWSTNERKGLSYLAEAFDTIVRRQVPAARLIIVGESLVPNVFGAIPAGRVDQVNLPDYYGAADLFVMPTLADNLPYTLLEAMGCGLPVVASNVGGVPEAVEHDATGLVVPARDAESLGGAIVELLRKPERRQAMGLAARARAERDYGLSGFLEAYERHYRDCISKRTGGEGS